MGFLAAGVLGVVAGAALRRLRGRARHGGPLLVAVDLLGTLFLAGGVALLFAGDPRAGGAALAVLAAVAAWGRWSRSGRALARTLRREERALAAREPGLTPVERRERLVRVRHPRWDPDLVARIARDQDSPEALARTLIRLGG